MTKEKSELATFGGGCFWGVEEVFRTQEGVITTLVGYTGGDTENPTYEQVCQGNTGHAEAVQIEFNPNKIPYKKLVELFFASHNPTTKNRQGPDIGHQYRSVIFYHSAEQKETAEKVLQETEHTGKFSNPIVTEIVQAKPFYKAEEYHQQYLQKRGLGACHL